MTGRDLSATTFARIRRAVLENPVGTVVPHATFAVACDTGERALASQVLSRQLKLDERLAGKVYDVDVADPEPCRPGRVSLPQPLAETGEHRGGQSHRKRLVGRELFPQQRRVERPVNTFREADGRRVPTNSGRIETDSTTDTSGSEAPLRRMATNSRSASRSRDARSPALYFPTVTLPPHPVK